MLNTYPEIKEEHKAILQEFENELEALLKKYDVSFCTGCGCCDDFSIQIGEQGYDISYGRERLHR